MNASSRRSSKVRHSRGSGNDGKVWLSDRPAVMKKSLINLMTGSMVLAAGLRSADHALAQAQPATSAAPAARTSAKEAAATAKPEDTEQWTPVPVKVTPGATEGTAPSDAIVLFDGRNLDEWVTAKDHSP